MRAALALGGALALAACAGGDRVTLLDPVREGGKTGAVAVIDPQYADLSQEEYEALEGVETDLVVVSEARDEARLRRGAPRVRRVTEDDAAARAALLQDLPLEVRTRSFQFGNSASELDTETLGRLVEFLESEIERYQDRYVNNENYSGDPPGLQIVIAGTSDFTRNVGCQAAQDARAGGQQLNELEESELCNGALSDRRAGYVYLQLEKVVQETGLDIDMREDVAWFGTSHFAARDASMDACIAAIAGVESVAELEPGQLDGLDLTPCEDDMNLRRVDNDFKAVFVTFR